MTKRDPRWDIDRPKGAQAELWTSDLRKAIVEGSIEVKSDAPSLELERWYVEYKCLHLDGEWHASGIATSKATLYVFTFGSLPAALVIETTWLKRAARRAFENKSQRKECKRGSHPTKGVVVKLHDIWATRDADP